jgi:hypothetical protein
LVKVPVLVLVLVLQQEQHTDMPAQPPTQLDVSYLDSNSHSPHHPIAHPVQLPLPPPVHSAPPPKNPVCKHSQNATL